MRVFGMSAAVMGLSVIGMGVLGGCAWTDPSAPSMVAPDMDRLEDVVAMMTGTFSSQEQSALDQSYFDIRLHMSRIWTDRLDGAWLYVEQAMAGKQSEPYRQRVYHVTQLKDGSIRSDVFLLPGNNPLRYAGAWKAPKLLKDVAPQDLVLKEGCTVMLKKTAPGVYEGGTVGNACPSDRAGAAYATSIVRLDESGLNTWDRGFDAKGKQVWGATKGGYEFRRTQN